MVISPFRGVGQKQAFCAFSLIRCRVMAVMDGFSLYGHSRRHDGQCLHPFYVVIFAVALLMGGCAYQPKPARFLRECPHHCPHGEIGRGRSKANDSPVPTGQHLSFLKQPTGDPFGTALIGLLRGKGYALAEVPTAQNQQARAAVMATAGVDFGYVVDMVGVDELPRGDAHGWQ